jgi:branched-chain amino acid transport system permease protein
MVLQAVASGIVNGAVYALIALSVVIVHKATDVVNFAGGEVVMAGGYLALLGITWFAFSYLTVFLLVAGTLLAGGMIFERVVLRRVRRIAGGGQRAMIALVMTTIGLSYLIKGLVRVVPYTEEVRRLPPLFAGSPVFLGPVILPRQDLAIVAIAAVAILVLAGFFRFTLAGKALRAISENARAAALIGIPVGRMHMLVWGLAAALAGLAGILLAPKLLLTPDFGGIVILGFAAAIIGGFASLPGCIAGGICLGVAENLVGIFVSSRAIAPVPFVLIMAVLILRPQGLFGDASKA